MANVYFLDKNFGHHRYTIGFEAFRNKEIPFAGNVLRERLLNTLEQLDINDRIVFIMKDDIGYFNMNGKPIVSNWCCNLEGLTFEENEISVGHVLELISGTILEYTFFKLNTSEALKESMSRLVVQNPGFEEFSRRMASLPSDIQSLWNGVDGNEYLRETFRAIVTSHGKLFWRKDEAMTAFLCEKFPCLIIYRKLDQFIYFRDEYTELLKRVRDLPAHERNHLNIRTFDIQDSEWDYLNAVRRILQIFRRPIIELQQEDTLTICYVIPFVYDILKKLRGCRPSGSERKNPFIEQGILKACEEILGNFYENKKMRLFYLATVLDPGNKLEFFEGLGFSSNAVNDIKDYFCKVYRLYAYGDGKQQPTNTNGYDGGGDSNTPIDEIERYLSAAGDPVYREPPTFYRGLGNHYPVISRMARDILAIPAIFSPSNPLVSPSDIPSKKKGRNRQTMIELKTIVKLRGLIPDETAPSRKCNSFDDNEKMTDGNLDEED